MKDKIYTLYMHIFPNSKRYIGFTSNSVKRRWQNGQGYKAQRYMWRAVLKYGWGNIEHKVLYENLTESEAKSKEIKLIANYESNNPLMGYNCSNGGEGMHGWKHSEETKQKMRKNHADHRGQKNNFYDVHFTGEKNGIVWSAQIWKRKPSRKISYMYRNRRNI